LGIERSRLQTYFRLKPNGDGLLDCIRRSEMSKLGLLKVTALSLALAAATPAFAAGFRGGDAMNVGIGGFRGAQASVPNDAAAHCAQRWAYYDRASGTYMGDDGQWRPCR
jgi:hypothetical protein